MPSTSRHDSRRSESSTSSSSAAASSSLSRVARPRSPITIKHKTEHRHRDRKTINLLKVQNTHVATGEKRIIVQKVAAAAAAAAAATATGEKVQDQIEQMDTNDDIETIDLCTPVNVVAPEIVTIHNLAQLSLASATMTTTTTTTTTTEREQTAYQSRTLKPNSDRRLILPAFPTSIENVDRPHLLLANVPDHLLTEQERDRRRSTKYRPPFHIVGAPPTNVLVNTKIPSFLWPIYQELFANVSEHLHVDMAIIDYNYARLSKCIDIWSKERTFRFKKGQHEVALDQKEYAIALEFYLQIDVDLFYMKTCSFRHVQPQEANRFLFCSIDPVARHEMTACGNCGLCYPKYDVKRRRQPSVEFGAATQRHQFVNRYESILNCPCSCDTYNIIYVLTCPCGKFDYIGESGATLADRIAAHRLHGNRIMHEAFLGQENIKLAHPNAVKSAETLSKDDMHLYRHSVECQSAIQMFLDENPRYWRFVPMSNEEADQPEQNILTSTMDMKSTDVQNDDEIKLFIQNLPAPPPNYRFSIRQYLLQYAYFKSRRNIETMPNQHLDLYNAKIIAVLPETGSTVLRQIVESLLITHAETKLNSSGRLVDNSNNNEIVGNTHASSGRHENVVWCEGLARRPVTSYVTAATTTTSK